MKLAEKRQVVEVLLCGAKIGAMSAALYLGADRKHANRAARLRGEAQKYSPYPSSFEHWGLEAAYRLIESSSTLVKEFFGRAP